MGTGPTEVRLAVGPVPGGPGLLGPGSRRRAQSDAARRLAGALLAEATGVAGWRILRDDDGRPRAAAEGAATLPDIALSHSGAWAAAALCRGGRIGVDIEVPRGRDSGAIAAAFLSAPEQAAVGREGEAALLAFWTLREAVAKALGGGLAEALGFDGTLLAGARDGARLFDLGGCRVAVAHVADPRLHLALAWVPDACAGAPEAVLAEALKAALAAMGGGVDDGR